MSLIASPYLLFNLSGDPFFQEPLTAEPEDSERTRDLFVGRTNDLRLLGNQVVGAGSRASTRAVVSGAPGVGKTSLVNRLKNELVAERSPAVLCAASPVRIQAAMMPDDFRAEVLRTLLLIRSTLLDDGDKKNDAELPAEQDFWRRVARMLNGEDIDTGGFSLSAAGAGVGMSRAVSRIASERRSLSLHSELAQAFAYLARGGKRRTLVHVNNLENLSSDAATAARQLVQNIRDDLLLPESHWLFVGTTDIVETVITAGPTQVQGIFPVHVELTPLAPPEVAELLRRRYQAMRRGLKKVVPPVAIGAAETLYSLYHGDLRNFLRLLSTAVQRAVLAGAPASLTLDDVIHTTRPAYRAAITSRLTGDDASYVERLVRSFGDVPFTESDVQDKRRGVGLSQSASSRLIDRLEAAGTCTLTDVSGRRKFYRWSGDTLVAFGA